MDRRVLIASGLSLIAAGKATLAFAQGAPAEPAPGSSPNYAPAESYSRDELVNKVSDFFGVTAEAAGAVIAKAFKDNGQPTAYIAAEPSSPAM